MHGRLLKLLRSLQHGIDSWWYPPALGLLCAADLIVLVVPLDPFLLSSCLLRPRSWWRIFLCMTIGATVGAWLVGYWVQLDPTLVERHFSSILHSSTWLATQEKLRLYGTAGMILFGLSPLPQVFPVLVGAIAGIPALETALTLGLGRAIKYGAYTSLAAHAPHVLARVPGMRKTMEQLNAR